MQEVTDSSSVTPTSSLIRPAAVLTPSHLLRAFAGCLCGFICLNLAISTASAWNSPGHMIIALVAYDQLDAATRAKALDILRSHPRFDDHFKRLMPHAVSRGDVQEQDQWIFAQAATWPDLMRDSKGAVTRRDVKQYHRPWWHFIDEPIFLNDEERRQFEHHLPVNLRRDPPKDSDDPNMNIIQAFKNSSRIVRDPSEPKEKRAVHLCWILHLAGDSHQPLHSCALFTTHRFPGGDHGANYLQIEHDWKLHAFWDDQIATEESYETLRNLAANVEHNRKLAEDGRRAAATLDIDKWIDESYDLARRYTYTKEVLQKVSAREDHSHLGPLDLSANYKSQAEAICERRAAEAGYRLAAVVKQLLQ
ncbi:MAG TPA: S1/P1 nuclease [Lacipirellulaceae bacterium]|nr:S1/P1 nuclease [Lacipirellulaceae bacterium]